MAAKKKKKAQAKKPAAKKKIARKPAPAKKAKKAKPATKAKKPAKVAKKPAPKAKKPAAKKPTPKPKRPAPKPAKRPELPSPDATPPMDEPMSMQPPPPPPDATPPMEEMATGHQMPPMHSPVTHPELDDEPAGDEVFEIFRTYDRDASGSIDRAEFSRLLEALGMSVGEEELAVALDIVDANHSGRISWDEFRAWWRSR